MRETALAWCSTLAMADSLYTDAAFYRMLFDDRQHDLPFYLGLAATVDGAVLELGIGTGRVALALARAGHSVVGVDNSEPMLARLAQSVEAEPPEVRSRVSWQHVDVAVMKLCARFPLVTCPFNGLAHHHTEVELEAFFGAVRRHLASGGLFAFDVTVPDPAVLQAEGSSVPWFRHPASGEVCRCDQAARYDPRTQILTLTAEIRWMESDREPLRLSWRLRQLYPGQVEELLCSHGLEIVRGPVELIDAAGYVCRLSSPRPGVSSGES